jgi:hypothetical protein
LLVHTKTAASYTRNKSSLLQKGLMFDKNHLLIH